MCSTHKQKRNSVGVGMNDWCFFAQAENVKNLKNFGYFHVKLLAKFGLAFIASILMILHVVVE